MKWKGASAKVSRLSCLPALKFC